MRPPALWPKELSLESLRGRLALLLALAFLPSGALALQSGTAALAARHAVVQGDVGARVLQRVSNSRDEVTQLREIVRSLAANANLFAEDRAQCRRTLTAFAAEFPQLSAVNVIDTDLVLRCSNVAGVEGRSVADSQLVRAASRSGDAVLGYVRAPLLTTQPVIGAVAPAQGNRLGRDLYVGVSRPVRPLLQTLRLQANHATGFTALLDFDGNILDSVGLDTSTGEAVRLSEIVRQSSRDAPEAAFEIDKMWAVGTTLEQEQLYLVAGWSPAPTSWFEYLRAGWALLAPVLVWLAAVAATWYAIEIYVARPLFVVEGLARAYARGEDTESEQEMLRGAPIEIANLRRTLAAMAKTLRGREARIADALKEERALLLEVNHRVKNNLQMVASMLSIQARATVDPSEARGLSRAQDRVQLLALAHAHIYESGEVRDIAIDQLTADIARTLIAARGPAASHVALDLLLTPTRTTADRAVPLAFLIGESVASVLDYVSGGGEVERIKIVLAHLPDRGFCVELDAIPGLDGSTETLTTQRLTGAFARQIGAELSRNPSRPFFMHIEAPNAAPDSGAAPEALH